ncbi:MAG: hypothetical protein JNM93_01650 [Bacteriovoracaceae bacterium]|nr:hypothetical protein [Bacteriovoracaceae bacterium]
MKKPVKLKSAFVLRNGVLVQLQGQFIKVNRGDDKDNSQKTQSVNETTVESEKKKVS